MKKLTPLIALCFLAVTTLAQLPKTEIWVFDLTQSKAGYAISNPVKITAGPDYNNQPYFTPDGEELYFVSNGKKGGKTDIYKYSFSKKRKKIKRITKTPAEAEYSPQLVPGKARISCVRVAKDTVTQQLCTYNLKGKKASVLFPNQKTVGYYCWKSQIDILAFHVPEPFTLMRHNFPYNKHDTIYQNIGRTIVNNRGKILYVDKSDSTKWQIKLLNPKRIGVKKYRGYQPDQVLATTLHKQEDFAILRGKDLLMGNGGFIYRKTNALTDSLSNWQPFLDLNQYQIYYFYRIAVSPISNKIAVVAYSGEQP